MAIKDLALAFNASDNSRAALKLAVQMCRKYEAALTGIYAHFPVRFETQVERWITDEMKASLGKADADAVAAIGDAFQDAIKESGFDGPVEWISPTGHPNDLLAKSARYHDLLLIGQYSNPDRYQRRIRAEELVMNSGKPIMVVPHGYQVRPFSEHAVVAWDGSRPAARALSDAMQILETKERLDVVTVGAPGTEGSQDSFEQHGFGQDVVTYLSRHGINAKQINLSAAREGVGATILGYCSETDPDVLVMGAYGHARLREELFGGVTRHILEHANVPVLMAH
ncbi:MAG: universal stress protein [Alphaproteobacteria bacterium]|nr:MAG: universal stress protein [Alphaproteobacteria bacterium]